jgi:hypothetical protein
LLIVCLALSAAWVGTGGAAPASAPVSLEAPAGQAIYPGEDLQVEVVNHSASSIYQSTCFVLARLTARGWRQVLRSHGVNIACAIWGGHVQGAHSSQPVGLALYDDLRPGTYRITLYYRLVPKHSQVRGPLTRRDRFARLVLTLGPAPAKPRPALSEKRILHLALGAANRGGDQHPTLIQHAAGSHFKAVLVGQGDLIPEWNWSYLIAIRGHFAYTGVGPGNETIHGTVITLVVDAATGQVTDSGLSTRYPPLERLGKVTTDLRR